MSVDGRVSFWRGRAWRLFAAPCFVGVLGMSAPPANQVIGTWGGEQVVLTVGPEESVLRLGCAEGHFTSPRGAVRNGRFAQAGSYTRHGGGPSTSEERPLEARYEGTLEGDRMTLTVRHGDATDTYVLMRGVQAKVIRCL